MGSRITQLYNRDKGLCHYCGEKTNRVTGSPLQATKDHVVPRSIGGVNGIDNYVLACADCNVARGINLFWCACKFCSVRINRALSDQSIIDGVFESLIQHNKPKIRYQPAMQQWSVRVRYGRRYFNTWNEAVSHALNTSDIHEPVFNMEGI